MTIENFNDECQTYKSSVDSAKNDANLLYENIPIAIVSNKGKLTSIINSENKSTHISVKNTTLTIKFKEIFFCTHINIRVQSGQTLKGVKVTAKNPLFGNVSRYNAETTSSREYIKYSICSFISEIEITPPETIFTSMQINKIDIVGKTIEDMLELEKTASAFIEKAAWINDKSEELASRANDYVGEIEKRQRQFEEEKTRLQQESESARQVYVDTCNDVEKISLALEGKVIEKKKIDDGIDRANTELRSIEARNEAANSSHSRAQSQLTALNIEIGEKEKKLKDLNEDVNLFTEDFRSYISQTRAQEWLYVSILALPVFVICAIAYQLLSGAVDLTFRFQRENIDIIALLSSRLPYVFAVVAIVAAATKVVQLFGRELINLHEGRRNLAQISIIARDVSDAEAIQVGLSKSEIYDRRMALKMDLLKSHISGMMNKYRYAANKKFESPPAEPTMENSTE